MARAEVMERGGPRLVPASRDSERPSVGGNWREKKGREKQKTPWGLNHHLTCASTRSQIGLPIGQEKKGGRKEPPRMDPEPKGSGKVSKLPIEQKEGGEGRASPWWIPLPEEGN